MKREDTQLRDEITQLKAKMITSRELLFCYFKVICEDRKIYI